MKKNRATAKATGQRATAEQQQQRSRYKGTVEKTEAAWSSQWKGFMSGVNFAEQGQRVKLKTEMDYENDDVATFSYLFASGNSSSKKKQRAQQEEEEAEKRRKKRRKGDDDDGDGDDDSSKMKKAVTAAGEKGISMDGMNRQSRRRLLRLTVQAGEVEQQNNKKKGKRGTTKDGGEQAVVTRYHELMDPKLQWYQQGPFPLDVVSERLVMKKAKKIGKVEGLKYNFHLPHPSWLAARARKRRESVLVSLGKRTELE